MLCEICKKNVATIHIQEIIDNQKKTLHICSECAAKKSGDHILGDEGFNIAEMLYNLSEHINIPGFTSIPNEDEPENEKLESGTSIICEKCGWNTQKLRETGRLGCPECYKVFMPLLNEAFENMHRGRLHVGKKPGGSPDSESSLRMLEIMNLQKELDELIQREEYEKAAVLRDKINSLKAENDKNEAEDANGKEDSDNADAK